MLWEILFGFRVSGVGLGLRVWSLGLRVGTCGRRLQASKWLRSLAKFEGKAPIPGTKDNPPVQNGQMLIGHVCRFRVSYFGWGVGMEGLGFRVLGLGFGFRAEDFAL